MCIRDSMGGTDTIVYFNDFESSSANINTGTASFNKYSYTGEYSTATHLGTWMRIATGSQE